MIEHLSKLPPEVLTMVRAAVDSLKTDAAAACAPIEAVHDHLKKTGMDAHARNLDRGLGHIRSVHEQLEGLQMMLEPADADAEITKPDGKTPESATSDDLLTNIADGE